VARNFGEEFAAAVVALEPGRWAGPIRSGFGLHLVRVSERIAGAAPHLADVRPAVEREFLAARRTRQLDAMYERLLGRYTVTIEPRAVDPPLSAAAAEKTQ
jgi:parvulin-like peptidyl-prolyl isomerase